MAPSILPRRLTDGQDDENGTFLLNESYIGLSAVSRFSQEKATRTHGPFQRSAASLARQGDPFHEIALGQDVDEQDGSERQRGGGHQRTPRRGELSLKGHDT